LSAKYKLKYSGEKINQLLDRVNYDIPSLENQIENIISPEGDINASIGIYSIDVTGTNILTASYGDSLGLFKGLKLNIRLENNNTDIVKLIFNGSDEKEIKKVDENGNLIDLQPNDFIQNSIANIEYNSQQWIWTNSKTSFTKIIISDTPPEDTSVLWFDTSGS